MLKLSYRTLMSTSFLTLSLLCGTSDLAYANPVDGVVTSGQASMTLTDKKLDILQQSNRAVIDWRGFDIASGEHTEFHQPNAGSIAINRVTSSSASKIDGKLTANGNVVIINQNGVLLGRNAVVDVNGLVATTADIDNQKAMTSEKLVFDKKGNPAASIVNKGQITAKEAGLIGFVAPNVVNDGIINARLGRVHLASGDTATVDMYGDGLMAVAVSDDVKSQLVSNRGVIDAAGGRIALTAAAGKTIVNSLISVHGTLKAQTVENRNGEIIISAEGSNAVKGNIAADKGMKSGNSTVIVGAKLDVSGRSKGESGGKVLVTGDDVALLSGTVIDATGYEGKSGTTSGLEKSALRTGAAGGDIRIGGDYLGGGDTATAKNLYVDKDVLVLNDALYRGDAGRTIFWSDDTTVFYGNVYARALGGQAVDPLTWHAAAGGLAGDGGFVETSGHRRLDVGGYVDLTASNGNRGTYFLDPANITIYGNFTPDYVSTDSSMDLDGALVLWLDGADAGRIELTYSTDEISGTTVTATAGSNIVTTSQDVSAYLEVGARIRIGAAGAVTTASTMGADTYTITAINGTTITLSQNVTAGYAGSTLYRGLVSQVADKSNEGNNAVQGMQNKMPLWVTNAMNGKSAIKFDGENSGNGDYFVTPGMNLSDFSMFFSMVNSESNSGGGGESYGSLLVASGNDGVFVNYDKLEYYPAHGFSTPIPLGTAILLGLVSDTGQSTGHLNGQALDTVNAAASNNFGYIGGYDNNNDNLAGTISEMIVYNTALTGSARGLVDQYQSMKWGIALTPPGSGATEAAQAMASTAAGDGVDGYAAFTTRYLEHLSQSADISLQASNDIKLDLQGDTLALAANRNFNLTAGNDIQSISTGSIVTSGNGSMTLQAGSNIDLTGLALQSGSGAILLATGAGDITLGAGTHITSGAAGNAITLASGRNIFNSASVTPLTTTGGGRWLAYSKNQANSMLGGLTGHFTRYNCSYGGACPALGSGNGILYSDAAGTVTPPVNPPVTPPSQLPNTVVKVSQSPLADISTDMRQTNIYEEAASSPEDGSSLKKQEGRKMFKADGAPGKSSGDMLTIDPVLARYLGI